jgi:large subunit ribosomal protein L24
MAAKIKKGDVVEVLTGRDRGKRGAVVRVDPERARVWVERVNIVKKHQKPTATTRTGGIIDKEAPLHVSNVALVHKNEPTRVAFRVVKGARVRWSVKHDEAIDG